ncbi:PAS domain-containing sensor histidine kinase [Thalassobacillus devorans]|uniref:histidine kinase n=1 Tax=Thalassobacillus devorans TaxID=279813 RepID=A0ABQ1PAZ9_9BACI|nr:ATP-binding protein [Thalassobacillus devorans]NIK29877.1 two-component system phosphate regulon sensor histidine kinase PhoR [Thalassobacillus devorans]GGC93558.1 PAS domain-containing sensor histidine kinase [Thalassobacillus devorans]
MRAYARPLITYTLLAFLIMLGLGVILAQLTHSYFVTLFEERIQNESDYYAGAFERYVDNDHYDIEGLEKFSQEINSAFIFIDEDKQLQINTMPILHKESTHEKEAIETATAMQEDGAPGQFVRSDYYYPVAMDTNEVNGTLVVITPVTSLENITKNIWLLISFTMLLGLVIIAIIGYKIFEKYIKPIRSAADTAHQLAEGNYKARTYEGYFGEAKKLSESINILARNLQEMTIEQDMQENRLEAVINNMGSGVLMIDEKGYIHLVNRAFLKSFTGSPKEYVGRLYYDAIPYPSIHEAIQSVFMLEKTVRETFVLPINIDRKHMEITGAPIFNESGKWKGVVLVFHDITELKRLEQMRKDFVANVSHELKTPITSIRGFSETLLDGAMKDPALVDQFLNIIYKESTRLQTLIKDLLELSKLEKAEFNLNLENIRLDQLLQDLLTIIEPSAEKKTIRIRKDMDPDSLIEGDSARLKQLFLNLLTNAVSYSSQNGEITLILRQLEDKVHVSITDTGIGIPKEEIPRIFERFYRVDKARSRNSGGTGLGLAIAKHILEVHEGKIEVDSEPGKGTTFHVTLPKRLH